jgi:hypothetical protein
MEPTPKVDLETLSDLATPWCVHVAVTLRIADHLAAGVTDLEGLAAAAGCDPDALHQVLGHLVGKGMFEEPAPGRFALNGPARELLQATPLLNLDGIGGRFAAAWGTLLGYVRTGQPATRLSREGSGLQAGGESRRGVGAAARCRPAGRSTEHLRPSLRSTTPNTAAWPVSSAGPSRGIPAAAAGTRRPSGC